MTQRFLRTVLVIILAAVSRASAAQVLYVDGAASIGGDGGQGAPYRTIQEAVAAANAQPGTDPLTIQIAEGTYFENPNVTIFRDGVRLVGSTVLVFDVAGLPTGQAAHAVTVRPNLPAGTFVPAGSALIRVIASHVEISGLVFDGGVPRP